LEDQSLLSRYRPSGSPGDHIDPGIKFAVAIASGRSMTGAETAAFGREVTRVLDEAVNIDQRSLYSGSGFAQFLIMGRAAYDQFHAIHSELTAQLNAAVIREEYESRTMAHISGQRGFSIAADGLSVASDKTDGELVDDPSFVLKLNSRIDLHDLKPDDEVDRFKIIRRVDDDRGGFAHVYRVFDKHEKVDRAMKVFKSPDPKAVLRETDALRKIDHPNVVELCLTGNQGDTWFLVTEFVDGKSLVDVGPLDCHQALGIAVEILKALEAIHRDGEDVAELKKKKELTQAESDLLMEARESALVHRDIKPANIMLTPQGAVKVLDFNIASRVQDPQITQTGTPEYMLPDPGLGTWVPAHDLFGCGVVLYELICGEHPYEHRKPVTHLKARDPRTWRPELHPALVQELIRACAPMQDELFSTAREMRSALEIQRAALNGDGGANLVQLGRTARQLRAATGLTAKNLSEKTGVSEDVLKRFEDGTSSLETPEAVDILTTLGDLLDRPRGSTDLP
jgi:serine/threonine protein kinase